MKLEQQIQKEIIEYLHELGAYTVKTIISNRAGIPDVTVCMGGRYAAFEVKRPGEKATPLQKLELSKIVKAGGIAAVVTSVDEVEAVLKRFEVE